MTPVDMPPELKYLMDKVADNDASALDRLFAGSALRQGLDGLLAELAQVAREEEGFSWADVGRVLDITKQAAQQRFGKKVPVEREIVIKRRVVKHKTKKKKEAE